MAQFKTVKDRCEDCVALIDYQGVWWCDEGNCPCHHVEDCKEWEDGGDCDEYEEIKTGGEDEQTI